MADHLLLSYHLAGVNVNVNVNVMIENQSIYSMYCTQ